MTVIFGVPKGDRCGYKLWEEKQAPQVIFEISSRSAWGDDLHKKWRLYERLGVSEYNIFDPEYDYLPEPLLAYRLTDGELEQITIENDLIFSPALNLEIVDTGDGLRFFDSSANEYVRTADETETALNAAEARIVSLEAELAKSKS